ncbi:thiamine pyrophosphate-binding protein [Candidatus Pelagibacter communis]|uniref:thiamine pyrophosphate-binding protein n=1 Tax=Pelagibacter ubique TaxID=198252 RepID=UPI00094CE407|nr:thiamine pyrophosphate-binding protein [Candidatus Pelagibacter ubique]
MKVSDFVVKFFEDHKFKYVFGVTGGGAMHLNDSFGSSKKIKFIMQHHEQAASMSAESYARTTGKVGLCNVTTGPGGTNAITGLVGAWIDSIPMIIISGQVATKDMINKTNTRQIGVQEINILDIVKPVVKYKAIITDEKDILYELQKALFLCKNGRPGPVWIDIPLDIQAKLINPKKIRSFKEKKFKNIIKDSDLKKIISLIDKSERPSIVIGNGIHISNSSKILKKVIKKLSFPVLSSWNASDILETSNRNYIGRFGIFGDRAANFTIQNSDLVIVLGSRLSQPQRGYNDNLFIPSGKIIMIDIDNNEIKKFKKKIAFSIKADLNLFLSKFNKYLKNKSFLNQNTKKWLKFSRSQKNKYSVFNENHKNLGKVNSFLFIKTLSKLTKTNTNIVTDMGTSFTCTMQSMSLKKNQRLFTSSGLAAMGWGLPGSIGSYFGDKKKNIICIAGDGGVMFNIQELQTIIHHKIPVKIFILFNNGYLTMKLMQKKNFKKYVGSDPVSGISCPNFIKIGKAFGIKSFSIKNSKNLKEKIKKILNINGPVICQIDMPNFQQLIPRLQTKMTKEGKFIPTPIDNLYPFLDEKEYYSNIKYKTK